MLSKPLREMCGETCICCLISNYFKQDISFDRHEIIQTLHNTLQLVMSLFDCIDHNSH